YLLYVERKINFSFIKIGDALLNLLSITKNLATNLHEWHYFKSGKKKQTGFHTTIRKKIQPEILKAVSSDFFLIIFYPATSLHHPSSNQDVLK
ncbi:MAG: hypothetical protein U9P79_09340, partial [Candidatus Cloacimonadota bacterium]|nr:hypothetical protein [Candidatus Cloacimonadota bacterium]